MRTEMQLLKILSNASTDYLADKKDQDEGHNRASVLKGVADALQQCVASSNQQNTTSKDGESKSTKQSAQDNKDLLCSAAISHVVQLFFLAAYESNDGLFSRRLQKKISEAYLSQTKKNIDSLISSLKKNLNSDYSAICKKIKTASTNSTLNELFNTLKKQTEDAKKIYQYLMIYKYLLSFSANTDYVEYLPMWAIAKIEKKIKPDQLKESLGIFSTLINKYGPDDLITISDQWRRSKDLPNNELNFLNTIFPKNYEENSTGIVFMKILLMAAIKSYSSENNEESTIGCFISNGIDSYPARILYRSSEGQTAETLFHFPILKISNMTGATESEIMIVIEQLTESYKTLVANQFTDSAKFDALLIDSACNLAKKAIVPADYFVTAQVTNLFQDIAVIEQNQNIKDNSTKSMSSISSSCSLYQSPTVSTVNTNTSTSPSSSTNLSPSL